MFLCATSCVAACSTCAGDDFFREKVAPIFQQRCLSCHNDVQRKGGFSLQRHDDSASGGFIEAGDARSSHLVELITPVAGRAEMPKDADPLTSEQISAIKKWIDDGASWPPDIELKELSVDDFGWWSYQPLVAPAIPDLNDPWVTTPIDAFILERMQQQGLAPSKRADRRTLIRRVTFDLTGLPPTPEEVEAFVHSDDPQAYEKTVQRLLASKHYGERWARHWLDVARYADTCGYDKDKLRPNAWPYRDYVIRSFNQDKPYARFVQEQIAGDVLFPGDPDGILGLGFIAAGPWDFIGHVEVPESKIDGMVARNLDRDDMVSGTLNAFCSVTVQCARCHNHKFDPITQEHYYGLQSIFAAVDRADRPFDLDPNVEQERQTLTDQIKKLRAELDTIKKEIADAGGERLAKLNERISDLEPLVVVKKSAEYGYHSAIEPKADVEKWVQVDLGRPTVLSRVVLRPSHDEYAGIGAGFGFPRRFKVQVSGANGEWKTIADYTTGDFPNPGLIPLEIEAFGESAQRIRVSATRLAERSDDYILALAEIQAIDRDGNNVALGKGVTSLDSIEAPVRWARQNLTDGLWPEGSDPDLASELADAKSKRGAILSLIETPERITRRDFLRTSLAKAEKRLEELPLGRMVYAATTHFSPQGNFKPTEGKTRPVHLLHRGDIQHPGDLVAPSLLPLDGQSEWRLGPIADEGERRAALGGWLTDRDHPLVWRSIVNRVWQYHFGEGIVATPNDFGRMGAVPTHPRLLDWMATEFRDRGQSIKSLHRAIVTSSVYQQSSDHREEAAAVDGSNQYLWRMNRRRLQAEEIRDSILQVSGTLDQAMGGPGFYLFKLEKTDHSPHYEYHKFDPSDASTHRRSIYRFIVRSQPDPWMTTLDCADSSQSTPRRTETLTSLQALSLMNSRFNLVMAKKFAERLRRETDSLEAQVERAALLVTQRTIGRLERDEMLAYARAHGLVNLCRFLFNLSEFVYLD